MTEAIQRSAEPTERAVQAREMVKNMRDESAQLPQSDSARFAHRNLEDLECMADQGLVQHEFEIWQRRMIPTEMRDSLDIAAYVATLVPKTSHSAYVIERILLAMDLLVHELPTVWAVQQRSWPLAMDYLLSIAPVFDKLTDSEKALVDPYVAHLLTPQFEGEVLPGPKKLRELVDDVIHAVLELPVMADVSKRKVKSVPLGDGNTRTTMVTDVVTNQVLESAITNVQNASEEEITRAEALQKIIKGRVNVNVRLNTLRLDMGDGNLGPAFMPSVGFVPEVDISAWADKVIAGRDLTDQKFAETSAYQFMYNQKVYIDGRDDTCRFPDCNARASLCDVDHCENYEQDENGNSVGGPTSSDNGVRLCRPHHNMKTAGLFSYVMFADGVAVFILPDGSTVTSIPHGHRRMRMRTVTNIREFRLKEYEKRLEAGRNQVLEDEQVDDSVLTDMTVNLIGGVLGRPQDPDGYYDPQFKKWRVAGFDDYDEYDELDEPPDEPYPRNAVP